MKECPPTTPEAPAYVRVHLPVARRVVSQGVRFIERYLPDLSFHCSQSRIARVRATRRREVYRLRNLLTNTVAEFEGPRGIRFEMARWFPESWGELSRETAYHQWILRTHMPVRKGCTSPVSTPHLQFILS